MEISSLHLLETRQMIGLEIRHETKVIARNMFVNWYKQFKTTEEMVNWFTQENDIMLK
jgi:hypothetical protein